MNQLIAYFSATGTTAEIAKKLSGPVKYLTISDEKIKDLNNLDKNYPNMKAFQTYIREQIELSKMKIYGEFSIKPILQIHGGKLDAFAKMFFDYTLTAVGTVAISPLLFYIAYRINKENPGPIFFAHTRIGKDGKCCQGICRRLCTM